MIILLKVAFGKLKYFTYYDFLIYLRLGRKLHSNIKFY